MLREDSVRGLIEGLHKFLNNLPPGNHEKLEIRAKGAIDALRAVLGEAKFEMDQAPCPPQFNPNAVFEPAAIPREEAQAAVANITIRIDGQAAVEDAAALALLGSHVFARLKADPVRGVGPVEGAIYPWNVIDYLSSPDLGRTKDGVPYQPGSAKR